MYDIAIIGAGVNGCSVAYEFKKENKSVVIFDKNGIASGGSGAAGAFIAPKFSKAGELKKIIEKSFLYSMKFYKKNFKEFFTEVELLHIAKNQEQDEILRIFKENTTLSLKNIDKKRVKNLTQIAKERESVSLDAGIVNAQKVCEAMIDGIEFIKQKVKTIVFENGYWLIDKQYKAKNLLLATGAYSSLLDEPYIKLRGIWGHRIDIKTTTENSFSLHQFVSISPATNNILAIGATHNVHYHPEHSTEPYNIEDGRKELLKKAMQTVDLKDVEVIKDYTGLRSGSFDYMPIVGSVVLASETLASCEKKIKIKNPDFKNFVYYPNLFMINGNGGYGFVLAPYLAKILKAHILDKEEINKNISPARFFVRWAKRRS